MDITEQKKARQALEESSEWLVRKGIAVFRKDGAAAVGKFLAAEWGVQLWVAPKVGEGRALAHFRTKFRGIKHQVICVSRIEEAGIEEFWVIKEFAEEWAGGGESCRFVLVKAGILDGDREILSISNSFGEAGGANAAAARLSATDARVVHDLEPYRYSKEYAGSRFEGLRSEADGKGGYRFVGNAKEPGK
ncbi:hypothetical protein OVA24_10655 [Luteolibacter sp. SL250]|uniref:hypothetical protein n=1 Tax=Luteolibacter sp. SL250 TaxID=2995170 RepID=UPI00226D8917|nr:hypothetical protein [Luteolibacter sp. SL250]WAC21843.1 hypothetical protein OVA24_10655 [Luteolibacter sp. SL250]